ncbi:hypothetical protein [Anditalea andensis]|uniref:BioF2-like acetyltransferase domain-containing protein n=1 Tax=Anditalea andensis TaxID=1048983 RepID=A0A074LN61_9BACT|nr:hypothetical protein [Anditalea andensis]KEO75352.1 hypothetical protein EL17_02090 [Anditalea andensis]
MNIKVNRYNDTYSAKWNRFIMQSANGTFMHLRDYMDYHKHLFTDHSLMIHVDHELVAVLPAHEKWDTLLSHDGLTYGGIIFCSKLSRDKIKQVIKAVCHYAHTYGFVWLQIRPVPDFYMNMGEDVLWHLTKECKIDVRRAYTSVITLPMNVATWSHGRRWGLKKAQKAELKIEETQSFELYWKEVLIPNLMIEHNSCPVHSLEEISHLSKQNPGHIRQFNIYHSNELLAGITIFETPQVVKTQYIAATPKGKKLHALDLLLYHLGTVVFHQKKFMDMGTSYTGFQSQKLNKGLLYWKESLGALSMIQRTYRIKLSLNLKMVKESNF